jgi:hypothetical protein
MTITPGAGIGVGLADDHFRDRLEPPKGVLLHA